MLTSRLLPIDEWPRLTGALGTVWEQIPTTSTVIVVERDGRIVAQWSGSPVFQYFVDGLEIVPDEQGNIAVARKLLLAMLANVTQVGVSNVLTGAADDKTRALLHTAGAKKADMDLYNWPIGDEA